MKHLVIKNLKLKPIDTAVKVPINKPNIIDLLFWAQVKAYLRTLE